MLFSVLCFIYLLSDLAFLFYLIMLFKLRYESID
jgi:hypothetical protein